jgi:hypothetical protein
VKAQIERQKSKYGWEFIFLGANIDAVETAASIGIDRDRAQSYRADGSGLRVTYNGVSDALTTSRTCGSILKNWSVAIETDYKRHKR